MSAMLLLLAIPFLTAAALAVPQIGRVRAWVDLGAVSIALAVALSLPFQHDPAIPLLRHDRLAEFSAILIALGAVARRSGVTGQLALGGMLLAAVSGNAVLTAAALAMAAAAELAPHLRSGWYRVPLCGAGLGLVLFGSILPATPLVSGCALLGLAALAVAVPGLLPLLPLLALHFAGSGFAGSGFAGPALVAVGLASVLACAAAVAIRPSDKSQLSWIAFGQAGVVAMAFGLRSPDAVFAGLVLAVLLVLSGAARMLVKGEGLAALLASVGLAGLPPFGVFPGLALVILATAKQSPWLLVLLLPALATMGWSVVARLPTPRIAAADRWSPAWIPLAAALLVGFALPGSAAAWLHALVREAVR